MTGATGTKARPHGLVRRAARAVRAGRAGAAGRAGWAVTAGALSSLGNLLLSLTVARLESIEHLGRFALAFSLYVLATGLSRATVTESVLAGSGRAAIAAGTRRAAAVGVACAVPLVVGGVLDRSGYLVIAGATLPGLVLHDYGKTVALGIGSPRPPCHREAVWTGLTAAAALLGLLQVIDPMAVFTVWAGTGALLGYAAALLRGHRVRPGWQLSRSDTRAAASFGFQYLLTAGSAQLALAALGMAAGMAVVGALSVGRTVLGPVTLLVGTASSLVIPYLARTRSSTGSVRMRAAVRVTVLLLAVSAPLAVLVPLLPDQVGTAVLGGNWRHAAPLLPVLAAEVLLAGVAMVGFAGHRVQGAGSRALLIGGALGVVRVPLVVVGGASLGAFGAAAALVLMGLLSATAWWCSYVRLLRTTGPTGGGPTAGPGGSELGAADGPSTAGPHRGALSAPGVSPPGQR
ncbi:hypothetical protein [Micromonospora psammae]|uniref:hypothetical protein n=1 Tax=Micromonospora sp. CPCC 205556 TaxID=3122398 RepID=UPI002FF23AF6